MRHHLLGYLLGAIEDEEREELEQALEDQPELQQHLHVMRKRVDFLGVDGGHIPPADGLAARVCEFICSQTQPRLHPARNDFPPVGASWSMFDYMVAAGIVMAAAFLFFPAVTQSRNQSRIAQCQNGLLQIGCALSNYSQLHGKFLPSPQEKGVFSFAGLSFLILKDSGNLQDTGFLYCPGDDSLARDPSRQLPSLKEFASFPWEKQELLKKSISSYGYSLGYKDQRGYQPLKNAGRANFALVADAPTLNSGEKLVTLHGKRGQNVLFDDYHVRFMTTCKMDCGDDYFQNDAGENAPGLHENDSVILPSYFSPDLSNNSPLPAAR